MKATTKALKEQKPTKLGSAANHENKFQNLEKSMGIFQRKGIFHYLFEHAPDPIAVINRKGIVLFLNQSHKNFFGVKVGEYAPSYYQGGVNEAKKIMKMLYKNNGVILNYETKLKNRDGKIAPMLLSAVQLKDAEGNVTGSYGIFRDITDRKKLEALLLEKEKLASIGEISTGLSHELRNPLMAISTSIGVLKKISASSEENKKLLNVIAEEAENLKRILDVFLQLCRVEKLKIASSNKIKEIMDNTVEHFHVTNEISSKIKINKNYGSLNSKILINSLQITMVFCNLISNALEAMPKGGTLKLNIREANEKLIIEITDTGKGIKPNELDKIFNIFYSTKIPKGIGAGLFLAKKFVYNHKGTISVESKMNLGTTFAIAIPIGKKLKSLSLFTLQAKTEP